MNLFLLFACVASICIHIRLYYMCMKKLNKAQLKEIFSKTKTWVKIGTCTAVIGLGIGGGVLVYNFFFSFTAYDYSKLSVEELEDDQEALMKKYVHGKDLQTYNNKFKPYELANIAQYNKEAMDCNTTLQVGVVKAMGGSVEQTIRSSTIKNHNSYFMENISRSNFVKVAKRFYGDDTNTKCYVGKCVDVDKGEYDEFTTCTNEEFTEDWGKPISQSCIYLISSKTTLESTSEVIGNQIKLSLELHPNYSVVKYVKQMKSVSGLKTPPVFSNVHLDIYLEILNGDLVPVVTDITESYYVNEPIKSDATGTIHEITLYDDGAIPEVSEKVNYDR